MALPASGPITLADVQTEFGGASPTSLGEYYAGGSYVPAGTQGLNGVIPSSSATSLFYFYGASAAPPPIFESGDAYRGAFYGNAGTTNTTVTLPPGTLSVVVTGRTAASGFGKPVISDITVAGNPATKLLAAHRPSSEYNQETSVWATNVSGTGPQSLSFTITSYGGSVMVFALKRQFASIAYDSGAVDQRDVTADPLYATVDFYKDGLTVCAWTTFLSPHYISTPFTDLYASDTNYYSRPLAASILVPNTTELSRYFTAGNGQGGNDGQTLTVISFKPDRFV